MNYLTQRSVYYYFLMREAAETGLDSWSFIAKNFGVKPKIGRASCRERVSS